MAYLYVCPACRTPKRIDLHPVDLQAFHYGERTYCRNNLCHLSHEAQWWQWSGQWPPFAMVGDMVIDALGDLVSAPMQWIISPKFEALAGQGPER